MLEWNFKAVFLKRAVVLIHRTGRSLEAISSCLSYHTVVLQAGKCCYKWQTSKWELQWCSKMCASLQSFVDKLPWGSQNLRIFYMKELTLSYNICYIICEWNTFFVPFHNLKLIWHVLLFYLFLYYPGHKEVSHIFTRHCLPNWSGNVIFPCSIMFQKTELHCSPPQLPCCPPQSGSNWEQVTAMSFWWHKSSSWNTMI